MSPILPNDDIAGYPLTMSTRPGERLAFMVSTSCEHFTGRLVRMRHGDENPSGPGYRATEIPSSLAGRYEGRRQVTSVGSFGHADAGPLDGMRSFTVATWLLPTLPSAGGLQGIICRLDPELTCGWGLLIDADGRLCLRVGGEEPIRCSAPLVPWRWVFVVATFDAGSKRATVEYRAREWPCTGESVAATLPADAVAPPGTPLTVAAASCRPGRTRPVGIHLYDGKIDSPALWSRVLAADELEALRSGSNADEVSLDGLIAQWRTDIGHGTQFVPDVGPHGLELSLVNTPTRLMTGHRWDGAGDSLVAPEQYSAIHFHRDDLDDCDWEPTVTWDVPDDLASGIYAFHVSAGDAEDHVVFYVCPPVGAASADVAFLIPTFSYLAYGNEHMQDNLDDLEPGRERGNPVEPDLGDLMLRRHPEFGRSLYDNHDDLSGCAFSTARRPLMNMRPAHRNWQTHSPRAFAADLYVVDWLLEKAVQHDVITDHELHAEGESLLEQYRILITGCHPEYWSSQMLDALQSFLDAGGRLMYLGGNGFYWVTTTDRERPWLIEVRRGNNGTRPWEARAGELRHSTTGEPGGLWRYRGRDPNRLVGIGFAAQGYDKQAGYYRRLPDSRHPRAAWIFDGVEYDEPIGLGGLVMNGAAGDEIDRADAHWGTPPHALVLATSAGSHSNWMSLVIEDILIAHPFIGGQENPLVRADIVFFETPGGGAVFSVGSIAFSGSLSHESYECSASRMTENVVRRFLDPAPFTLPAADALVGV